MPVAPHERTRREQSVDAEGQLRATARPPCRAYVDTHRAPLRRGVLHPRGLIRDDAVLLVSEVVGNSLRHARSEARVRVDLAGPVLRVEVADDSLDLPRLLEAPAEATGGRGVLLLDRLASRCGADRNAVPPPGKVVWFELAVA